MKGKTINLAELSPNDRNPRSITGEAFQRLCDSISRDPQFMELRPMIIDEDKVILGGNQRYRACLRLGMTEVPAAWIKMATCLTPEQRKRFVVIDNSPEGMAGEWDFDMLSADWELPELGAMGFDKLVSDLTVPEIDAPVIPDGDRSPLRSMTFTLHDEQFEVVELALAKARGEGGDKSEVNENSNGNLLAFIARRFTCGQG